MRRQTLDYVCASCRHCSQTRRNPLNRSSRRYVQISATPSSSEPQQSLESKNESSSSGTDACFEVLGSPFSLLSASISPSQNLYTRKGTLVGFNGTPENVWSTGSTVGTGSSILTSNQAVSTLSLLEPFRRALFGIPFLYQRVTSTTPYNALISTKSKVTSLVVVHLDGRLDWMVAQRNALLAWTGQTLSLSPRLNTKMVQSPYLLYTKCTGTYSMMQHPPQPYRFKSSSFRLQIPNPITWLPDTRFWRTMRESTAWKFITTAAFTIRTWGRRTIWGDRLFLHFHGPATILVQSRGSALSDVLTTRDVTEIADSPADAVPKAPAKQSSAEAGVNTPSSGAPAAAPALSYASVNREGTVKFNEEKQ
ncbi:Altered inheritance of mitochondria protein 24, mitochondrial [Vermiconidia calcicola]|uniref:Altered inheritance of mitochondria protein 24, mitochondrial n=1 Tax=Vermiconidia calcicola TaxID=1690605 RepID=A0ACC3N7D6_9PEZI|nr:Altered inheritance of mitochondria protein 24, mitochondrial [Vermiconidia calcicola]